MFPVMWKTTAALLSLLAIAGCSRLDAAAPTVQLDMRNVDLHLTDDIHLQVHRLAGSMAGSRAGRPINLDDTTSYRIDVSSGEVAIDLGSLNAVVSRALGDGKSNVRHVRLAIEDGTLRQKGTIDKAIDIPFNAKGAVGVTADGKIRIHTESVKGYGVPVKPLMKIFGVEMDNLLRVQPGNGITVENNDLILDPSHLLPPPVINGRVTSVRVEGQSLVQVLGGRSAPSPNPPPIAPNHILWRGGQIAFGKLTMTESDLEIVDGDPADPLDFSVDGWNRQLTAGYSKVTTKRGLQAHVPDYNDLTRRTSAAAHR
jgi:hypothetical protein